MRHHRANRKFGRERWQRIALLRSLASSLILHGKIQTNAIKAKELRPFVEKLVSASKADSVASRRLVAARLRSPEAVKKLHTDVAKRYASRAGGYTRIVRLGKIGNRVAEMARIEFLA